MSREWDLTSTHSLESAAEWLRKKSDALVVMVVSRTAYAQAVHAEVEKLLK